MQIKPSPCADSTPLNRESLLLIVVGAHLSAERHDRTAADWLRREIVRRVAEVGDDAGAAPSMEALICTDLWYLNDPSLRDRPVISVGGPEVNALTAYLADKLPAALAIDDVLMVQMDVEPADAMATCWGVDHTQTARAVELFVDRYLDLFLRVAVID